MDERDFELLMTLNDTKNITHAADQLKMMRDNLDSQKNYVCGTIDVAILRGEYEWKSNKLLFPKSA